MSDDEDKKGKEKPKGDIREKPQVEPIPKKPDFLEWLERLFYETPEEEHFPEKLELRVVSGKNLATYGPKVRELLFKQSDAKPTRTKLVHISNELVHLMQRDCDIQRRSTAYHVAAIHYSRDPDFYERWTFRCMPTASHSREGAPRDDEDGDELPPEKRFMEQVLGHGERMFQLYGGGFEGILDRMDRILERQEKRIEAQDARIEKQNEMLERALSLQAERDERLEWTRLKVKGTERALEMGLALAPPILNQIVGRKILPTEDSPESITLKTFFKTVEQGGELTPEQADKIFGVYDDNFKQTKPGLLTFDQAKILGDVASCQVSPDELDKLIIGPYAVSAEQLLELSSGCGLSMTQLVPLQAIFDARYKRIQQRQQKKKP